MLFEILFKIFSALCEYLYHTNMRFKYWVVWSARLKKNLKWHLMFTSIIRKYLHSCWVLSFVILNSFYLWKILQPYNIWYESIKFFLYKLLILFVGREWLLKCCLIKDSIKSRAKLFHMLTGHPVDCRGILS